MQFSSTVLDGPEVDQPLTDKVEEAYANESGGLINTDGTPLGAEGPPLEEDS